MAFDAALDEWRGPEQLDHNRPAIFHCNGAECWKSYKAARIALGKGFKTVYWCRGGMPEWDSNGMPVESSAAANAEATPRTAAPAVAKAAGTQ